MSVGYGYFSHEGPYAMSMPSGSQPKPGPLARAFSGHVRMIMARDRITAQALAEASGLTRSYLGKRLRDEVSFTINDLEAISLALGLDLPKL
jgi:DNA-binding phage protein